MQLTRTLTPPNIGRKNKMKRLYIALLIAFLASVPPAAAQDARTVLQAASAAMGAANLKSIQYSGSGWVTAVGQSYNSGLQNVGEGWPKFDAASYTRTIDYDAPSLREEEQ